MFVLKFTQHRMKSNYPHSPLHVFIWVEFLKDYTRNSSSERVFLRRDLLASKIFVPRREDRILHL